MPYSTVVVGTDGSATAETAVQARGRLAADHGARLVIVTAYEAARRRTRPRRRRARAPMDIKWALTDRDAGGGEGAGTASRSPPSWAPRAWSRKQWPGVPPDVLLETAAADFDADVIVVGSKGLTGASRFVLGSVASAVSHHAPCDVLIVQTAD